MSGLIRGHLELFHVLPNRRLPGAVVVLKAQLYVADENRLYRIRVVKYLSGRFKYWPRDTLNSTNPRLKTYLARVYQESMQNILHVLYSEIICVLAEQLRVGTVRERFN